MRLAAEQRWTEIAAEERAEPTVSSGNTRVRPTREVTAPAARAGLAAPAAPTIHDEGRLEADSPPETVEVFDIGERCADAYRRSEALHYEALRLLAEFDRLGGFEEAGFPATADWLAWRVGIKIGPARERVQTARALAALPKTVAAMREGGLSFAKARALTRVATPENEDTLLQFARSGSAANLERVVRGWKELNRAEEISAEQVRYGRRRFSAFIDDDGMVVVRGRLDPEAGAMLMRAVEATNNALFRAPAENNAETTPEQRRADALGLLAERALTTGFGASAPVSGQRAARTEVVLHVEASTLDESGEVGLSELEEATRVDSRAVGSLSSSDASAETSSRSAETARRVACDTGVVDVQIDREGRIGSVGHRRRTVSPALRRALEVRDRGCRFPGCGLRFTDAHHIRHWADGGEIRLDNLVLLCRRHHRAVHEGGMRLCLGSRAGVVFFDRTGRAMCAEPAPARAVGGPEVAQPKLPTGSDLAPGWKRDRDIPWDVEAAVWDALDTPEEVLATPSD